MKIDSEKIELAWFILMRFCVYFYGNYKNKINNVMLNCTRYEDENIREKMHSSLLYDLYCSFIYTIFLSQIIITNIIFFFFIIINIK